MTADPIKAQNKAIPKIEAIDNGGRGPRGS